MHSERGLSKRLHRYCEPLDRTAEKKKKEGPAQEDAMWGHYLPTRCGEARTKNTGRKRGQVKKKYREDGKKTRKRKLNPGRWLKEWG